MCSKWKGQTQYENENQPTTNNKHNQSTALANHDDIDFTAGEPEHNDIGMNQDEDTGLMLPADYASTRSNIRPKRLGSQEPGRKLVSVCPVSNKTRKQRLRSLRKDRKRPERLVYKRRSKEKLDQEDLRKLELWYLRRARRYSSMRQSIKSRCLDAASK